MFGIKTPTPVIFDTKKPKRREDEMRKRNPSSRAPTSGASAGGPSKVEVKRGPWTAEEDEMLSSFIRREGEGKWRTLPKRAGLLRCGKSCRLRWMNYLRPSIKHGNIAPDEEDLILRLHRLLGNRWSLIAGRIPGRTDNEIKNYWNTHLSKKLISQGIDPRTHKPLNPNPDHNLKEPAPVTAPVPYPNPNPNPNPSPSPNAHPDAVHKPLSSDLEEIDGSSRRIILHDHQSNYSGGIEEAWQNSEEFELMGSAEDGGVDCGTDDVFSSFLNSLINEDMFLQPQEKQQQHQNMITSSGNNIGQNEPIDPTMQSAAGFGLGYSWEAGLPSATLGEDAHGQFVGQPSKHF